jgi:hypothetical protein
MYKEFEVKVLETIQETRLAVVAALTPEQLLEVTDIYELRIQKLRKKVNKLKKVIKELER